MPSKGITNPNNAFGYTGLENALNQDTTTFVAVTAVAAKALVQLDTVSSTLTGKVETAVTSATTLVAGVALAAAAAGETVVVAVPTGNSYVTGVNSTTTAAVGDILIASTTVAGSVEVDNTPAVGAGIGVACSPITTSGAITVRLGRIA